MPPPSSRNSHRSGGRSAARRAAEALSIRCALASVKLRSTHAVHWARHELEDIVKHTRNGILVRTIGRGDVMANLMLVRATHEFVAAAAEISDENAKREYLQFAALSLLPACKRIIQEFISQKGMDGIWMEDGGLLAALPHRGPKNPALATPLRLNSYWYAALESTGIALRGLPPMATGLKDPSGDHFERLAGRFRRAFSKNFWCEKHQRVCPPALRHGEDHGDLPDAEQLLLMLLPSGPMPRTKQIGVLKQLEARALAPVGLWVRHDDGTLVESLLHRAWMAQALGNLAETDTDRQRAVNAARPLQAVWELAKTTGVHPFYRDGAPLGKSPSPVVTAEVLITLERFLGMPGHPTQD